jgi:peptidoglycan hydrolase-like protein with peptidoglycan-binding domain
MLKTTLTQLNDYHGVIDERFTPELVQGIENFQADKKLEPVDGIAGSMTLAEIAKFLPPQP